MRESGVLCYAWDIKTEDSMTKHVLDRPRTVSTKALARAAIIERRKRPHLATLTLQRRNRPRGTDQRPKFYAQVIRGKTS